MITHSGLRLKRSRRYSLDIGSNSLEIGALGDREALQVAARAVEVEFDRTQADPGAATVDARAAGFDALSAEIARWMLPPKSMRSGPSSSRSAPPERGSHRFPLARR
jgi:hypothetical protein